MYQRNATTALKPIFPAHNQGNVHMCLESPGTQTFILNVLKKKKIGFRRSAEFTAFYRPQPPPTWPRRSLARSLFTSPLRGPAGGCTRTPPTPSAERAGSPSSSAGGTEGAPTRTPPLPTKRALPTAALTAATCARSYGEGGAGGGGHGGGWRAAAPQPPQPAWGEGGGSGHSTGMRRAAHSLTHTHAAVRRRPSPPSSKPGAPRRPPYLHITATSFQMERGRRREEARGLRSPLPPRDPPRAHGHAPQALGHALGRARARAAQHRAAHHRTPCARERARRSLPSVSPQRPPQPQPREQRQQPARAPPQRRGPHRTAAAGPKDREGEEEKRAGERRGRGSPREGGGHHPPLRSGLSLPQLLTATGRSGRRGGSRGAGKQGRAERAGAPPHRHRQSPCAEPRPGGRGDWGRERRRGSAEVPSLPLSERVSERAPAGEKGEGAAASSPHSRPPPHAGSAGSIATNMAAAQSPGGADGSQPLQTRESLEGRGRCAFPLIGSAACP